MYKQKRKSDSTVAVGDDEMVDGGHDKKGKRDKAMIAKKDFKIVINTYKRVIKEGEDISDVPEKYHENLKTEGVL